MEARTLGARPTATRGRVKPPLPSSVVRVRLAVGLVTACLLALPAAAQAVGLAPATKVFPTQGEPAGVSVAMAPNGYAAAAWVEPQAEGVTAVRVATRPPGGAWSVPVSLAGDNTSRGELDLAVNGSGAAAVAWQEPAAAQVAVATRPAGAGFADAQRIDGELPRVGIDAAGEVTLLYHAAGQGQVRQAPAGGDLAAALPVAVCSLACTPWTSADLAVAPSGGAIAGWTGGSPGSAEFATRAAGGDWVGSTPFVGEAPTDCGPSATGYRAVRVAIDPAGKRVGVVLGQSAASTPAPECEPTVNDVLTLAVPSGAAMARGPNVAFGPIPGSPIAAPAVATGAGIVDVAWSQNGVRARRYAPNGTPEPVTSPPGSAPPFGGPEVALGGSGRTLLAWTQDDAGVASPFVSTRAPEEALEPAARAGDGAAAAGAPTVAMDAAGNGLVAWPQGLSARVRDFDSVGPAVSLSGPRAAKTGERVRFSASATDRWGPVTIAWTFGDGSGATGAAVSHVFTTPASRAVTATATDAVGNTTARTRIVRVAAAVPVLSDVSLLKSRFRVGKGATRFRFMLNQAAEVSIRIEHDTLGRRRGDRCVSPERAPTGTPCKRWKLDGTLKRQGAQGPNKLPFSGRVGGEPLRPGGHRATLRAEAGGNSSERHRLRFEVLP